METSTYPDERMIRVYDDLAPVYDAMHRRWLRFAGGEAQAALEAAVRMAISPQAKLLDAGCGTGRFSRALLAEGVQLGQITLLDASRSMLAACSDIPARRKLGRLEALPFADAEFDVIACAWVLETVPKPKVALHELCRVLRPGGALCLTFCAWTPGRSVAVRVARSLLSLRGTGSLLRPDDVAATLRFAMPCDVRMVPVAGPAAMTVARRHVDPARTTATTFKLDSSPMPQ